MKKFTVGRGNEADVVIDDNSISRTHIEIEIISSTQVSLKDLNSTNGSFLLRQVGKTSLSKKQVANIADRVLLGKYETTIAELLNALPDKKTTSAPVNDHSGQSVKTKNNFSRYIRLENGQFVRKP